MELLFPLVGVVFVIFLVGMVLLLSSRYEKKRTVALQEMGSQIGFRYLPHLDEATDRRLKELELFQRGRGNSAWNYLRRTTDDVDVLIFDHKYTTRSGKNSHTWRQSVVAIYSHHLDLPQFTISPEGFFHKIFSAMGFQDIDFAEHPEFSRKFLLRGADEASIRSRLQNVNLDRLADFEGICIEASGDQFLVWYGGKRHKPAELQKLFETAFEVFVMFRG